MTLRWFYRIDESGIVYSDILILSTLRIQARHGYDIKRSLEESFGGFLTLTNSMLYPALQRFEEMGAVRREVVRQEGRPDRHIYSLTDRGNEVMHDLLCDFPPEIARRDAEFQVRAAFFGLLMPEERIAILETRKATLTKRRNTLPRLKAVPHDSQIMPYLTSLLTLREQQFQRELDWIEQCIQEQQLLIGGDKQ